MASNRLELTANLPEESKTGRRRATGLLNVDSGSIFLSMRLRDEPAGNCTISAMPNIAVILKSEIARVARKEVRAETANLKKTAGAYRTALAALKRRVQSLEQQLHRLAKVKAKPGPVEASQALSQKVRFSAKNLASHRRRLALSADDYGLLLGASGQSVYNWESGKVRPKAQHMPAIVAVRTMSKKEAAQRLASLRSAS